MQDIDLNGFCTVIIPSSLGRTLMLSPQENLLPKPFAMIRNVVTYWLLLLGLSACVNPFGEGSFDPSFASVSTAYLALLNPSEVDLGTVPIGQETRRTLVVSNQGGRTAEYLAGEFASTGIEYSGGKYPGLAGTCGKNLAPGESCQVEFSITPALPATTQILWTLRYWDGKGARALEISLSAVADNGSFQAVTGFDLSVEALLQTDEGIYAAGDFTARGRHRGQRILRMKPGFDGAEDSAFNSSVGFNSTVIALAGDGGKIYAGGAFSQYGGTARAFLARLNGDGTLDSTFSAAIPSTVRTILIDPMNTGKIYVGGGATSAFLLRLNADGSTDTTFSAPVFTGTRINQIIAAPGPTTDLYVGGTFTHVDGAPRKAIVRLDDSGFVNTNFGASLDGFFSLTTSYVESVVAVDGTEDILVGGNFTTLNGTNVNGIARIGADGIAAAGFSSGAGSGFNQPVSSLAEIPGGSGWYVMGEFTAYSGTNVRGIARLNADGVLQTSFNPGSSFDLLDVDYGTLLVRSDESLCAAGSFNTYQGKPAKKMVCLDATGAIDSRFKLGAGVLGVNALAALSDGSGIYVGGTFTTAFGSAASNLVRVKWNAERDSTFAPPAFSGAISAIQVAKDGTGDLYVGGAFSGPRMKLARLQSDGTLVTSFVPNPNGDISSLAQIKHPTSALYSLYIGGAFLTFGAVSQNYVARLSSDGSLDSTFAPIFNGTVQALVEAPGGTGAIYIGGSFTTVNGTTAGRLAKLNWNGTLDPTFAIGTGFNSGLVKAILPLASGKILVGGSFTTYQGTTVANLVRLNTDGSLDTSVSFPTISGGSVDAIVEDGDGRIKVGGTFVAPVMRVIALLADGSVDPGFTPMGTFDNPVKAMAVAPDGSNEVYAGGDFSRFDGKLTDGLVRLSPSGILD